MSKNNDDTGNEYDNTVAPETNEQAEELAQDSFFIDTPSTTARSINNAAAIESYLNEEEEKKTAQASYLSDPVVDPITQAIRDEILQKQREQLSLYLSTNHPELEKHTKDDEKFRQFLANLTPEHKGFIDDALKDKNVKAELEKIELAGYKNVHEKFKDSFHVIQWNDKSDKENTKAQIVRNDVGEEICTLNETMHNIEPKLTVQKQDGSIVTVDSYRTVDFPIKLDKADGTMHLSIVALDEKGNRPPASKAVYFTAHYEEGPDGKPLLKEVSSPIPMKFMGEGKDAIGYIEHGDKIYTMPVTRGKYEEMMKEVAINKGQGVDLSQTVDTLAEDLVRNQHQEHPLGQQKQTQSSEIISPPSTNPSQVLQPQQAKVSEVPKTQFQQAEILNITQPQPQQAETISPNEKIQNDIGIILNNSASDLEKKQTQIKDLIENMLNGQDLTVEQKVQGINTIANSINSNANILDTDKTKIFESANNVILNSNVDTILNDPENALEEKKTQISDLIENMLNGRDLTVEQKVQGINTAANSINNNANIPDIDKTKMFGSITSVVLENNGLDEEQKQQAVSNIVNSALNLETETGRAESLNEITNSILKSPVDEEAKAAILEKVGEAVISSNLSNDEKLIMLDGANNLLLNSKLSDDRKITMLGDAVNTVLSLELDNNVKGTALEGLTGAVINSELSEDKKAAIFGKITDVVLNNEELSNDLKDAALEGLTGAVINSTFSKENQQKILGSILEKGKEIGRAHV